VQTGREAAADSHFLRSVSEVGVEQVGFPQPLQRHLVEAHAREAAVRSQARNVRASFHSFDAAEFVARLQAAMALPSGHVHWQQVGQASLRRARRVPTVDFMLGPLEIQKKARNRPVQERAKREPTQAKKPAQVRVRASAVVRVRLRPETAGEGGLLRVPVERGRDPADTERDG
jgi:hypothetical protein